MADPFIAQIFMFAGNFAPRSWAFCDGQILAINTNQALFSLLGTTYGGDGRTTFALPELRGRVPVGCAGQGPGLTNIAQGQKSGSETVNIATNNLPAHSHPATGLLKAVDANGNQRTPGNNFIAADPDQRFATATLPTTMAADAATITLQNQGGNQAFDIRQPSLAINYIIAIQGLFPSRN